MKYYDWGGNDSHTFKKFVMTHGFVAYLDMKFDRSRAFAYHWNQLTTVLSSYSWIMHSPGDTVGYIFDSNLEKYLQAWHRVLGKLGDNWGVAQKDGGTMASWFCVHEAQCS